MADTINLRQARKRKARSLEQARADENRIAHGRTKAEKLTAMADQARAQRRLDGHRLQGDGDGQ